MQQNIKLKTNMNIIQVIMAISNDGIFVQLY